MYFFKLIWLQVLNKNKNIKVWGVGRENGNRKEVKNSFKRINIRIQNMFFQYIWELEKDEFKMFQRLKRESVGDLKIGNILYKTLENDKIKIVYRVKYRKQKKKETKEA